MADGLDDPQEHLFLGRGSWSTGSAGEQRWGGTVARGE